MESTKKLSKVSEVSKVSKTAKKSTESTKNTNKEERYTSGVSSKETEVRSRKTSGAEKVDTKKESELQEVPEVREAQKANDKHKEIPSADLAPEKSKATNNDVEIDLREMLEAGCHFGHQARRWNPKMAEYIFVERDKVHIFDLTKTKANLEKAMEFITEWVKSGKEIVFVGTKRQAKEIVKEEALKIGAPYVTERWLGGTMTNWEQMQVRINRLKELKKQRDEGTLKKYTKKERVLIDREISRLERFFGGIAELKQKPEALFVVDSHREKTAVREARRLGVTLVAMVDSNADPEGIEYVIPVNDDAVRSIKLVVTKIAESYSKGKVLKK